jgi:hypothetical protein
MVVHSKALRVVEACQKAHTKHVRGRKAQECSGVRRSLRTPPDRSSTQSGPKFIRQTKVDLKRAIEYKRFTKARAK